MGDGQLSSVTLTRFHPYLVIESGRNPDTRLVFQYRLQIPATTRFKQQKNHCDYWTLCQGRGEVRKKAFQVNSSVSHRCFLLVKLFLTHSFSCGTFYLGLPLIWLSYWYLSMICICNFERKVGNGDNKISLLWFRCSNILLHGENGRI